MGKFKTYLAEAKALTPAMINRTAKIKNEFVTAIRKIKTTQLRIEWFAYEPEYKNFYVVYDVPREIRHPDEYGGEDEVFQGKAMVQFDKEDRAIIKVVAKFIKRYPKFNFDIVSDVSGQGIEKFY